MTELRDTFPLTILQRCLVAVVKEPETPDRVGLFIPKPRPNNRSRSSFRKELQSASTAQSRRSVCFCRVFCYAAVRSAVYRLSTMEHNMKRQTFITVLPGSVCQAVLPTNSRWRLNCQKRLSTKLAT